MVAGRFPGGISLPDVPRAEPQNFFRVSRPLRLPDAPKGIGGKPSVRSGSRPPSASRDEANKNPLYWHFAHTARSFTTCQKLGLGRIC